MSRAHAASFTADARPSQRGFTLIELAVVVFVVTIILGSILVPLSAQVEQRQIAEAQRQMEEIKEAIIGYAIWQGYLPCPDKTVSGGIGLPNDGLEDRGAPCAQFEGNVPWATLGLASVDPWGSRFRYRVTAIYADHTNRFALDASPSASTPPENGGAIRLCSQVNVSTTPATCPVGEELTVNAAAFNSPVAVIVSHGPNRWGAISASTSALMLPSGCTSVAACTSGMSAFERANADEGFSTQTPAIRTFVSRSPSSVDSSTGAFDDLVVWLSPHVLRNRMVAAGKLP